MRAAFVVCQHLSLRDRDHGKPAVKNSPVSYGTVEGDADAGTGI